MWVTFLLQALLEEKSDWLIDVNPVVVGCS
jgi:hypothetical protein